MKRNDIGIGILAVSLFVAGAAGIEGSKQLSHEGFSLPSGRTLKGRVGFGGGYLGVYDPEFSENNNPVQSTGGTGWEAQKRIAQMAGYVLEDEIRMFLER